MNFCILSPTAGLERYAKLSRTHLCLAHITNEKYWAFYKFRRELQDHIILDNGGYEGKPDIKRLLDRIKFFNPNVVVLPDYLGEDWKKTWKASTDFLDSYFFSFEDIAWMYVPQSEPGNIMGFIDGLYHALDDERISWIGLPRALSYSITNDLSMRVRMAEQIRKKSSRVKIHALGMVKGNVSELNALRETGCVASIDSNAPVWRGWLGYTLMDHWHEAPCNYEDPRLPELDSHPHHVILENLGYCGVTWKPTS